MIIKIAVPGPFFEPLDYLAPKNTSIIDDHIGLRVLVPLRHQKVYGFIVGLAKDSSYPLEKLKHIIQIIDQNSIIDKSSFKLVKWISNYYHCSLYASFNLYLPSLLVSNKQQNILSTTIYIPTNACLNLSIDDFKRAPKQQALLQLLQQKENLSGISRTAILEHGINSSIIKNFSDKQLISKKQKPNSVLPQATTAIRKKPLSLSEEQQYAVDIIINKLSSFLPFLIYGVTGSGKTEVYIQIIQEVIKKNQQALVLVPEISLTPQTIARFQARFTEHVVAIHSKLTPKQRLQSWIWAKQGNAKIVISTRSGIFTEFANLGLIIVDEEHDASFKQQNNIRYNARDIAIVRAKMLNIPILLGSATPSLESLYQCNKSKYQLLKLKERPGAIKNNFYSIIDMRAGNITDGLSQALLDKIKSHLDNNSQILLFINRLGYAPSLFCRDCGWLAKCPRCDAPYTLHYQQQRLICHRCNSNHEIVTHCGHCKNDNIFPTGVGTERIEEAIQLKFPHNKVLRLDKTNITKKGQLEDSLKLIENNDVDIIIGTQMIAKGHHFPNITLVGIVNIDGGLFSSDFRALEKTAQLIVQVGGRAGRAEKPGEVCLQTYNPDHPLLNILIQKGYSAFSEKLLQERKFCQWPPFYHLAVIHAEAHSIISANELLNIAKNKIQTNKSIKIFGPVPNIRPKQAGLYRVMLIVQSKSREIIAQTVKVIRFTLSHSKIKQARWSIDIDPQDML